MMRTEGSFTKAPGVVPRPVASISQRSIMRMGETVFVPTRCTLMRCGMSEPVTKTVCSVNFSFRCGLSVTGVSASEAPVAIRTETAAAITLFTMQKYTRWLALQIVKERTGKMPVGPTAKMAMLRLRARSSSHPTRGEPIPPAFTRDSNAFAGSELELLRQARVPEPVRRIVSEAGIILTVSLFAGCLRRILIE
jgi:hypothetical protein